MPLTVRGVEGTPDRTDRHRLKWICDACPDRKTGKRPLIFESDYPECPSCGRNGLAQGIRLMTLIHLIVPSKYGPIVGQHGRRYFLACDRTRATTATPTNREACTNRTGMVNCDNCRSWMRTNNVSEIEDTLLLKERD